MSEDAYADYLSLTPLFTKYMWFKKISMLGFQIDMDEYSIEDINFFCDIEVAINNGRAKPT